MSASMGTEMKAEPNLTPLLDVVFQLITFFMLLINFSNDNYDARVRLPVAGSARPMDDAQSLSEDRFVLNVDRQGHLLLGGKSLFIQKAAEEIQSQAKLIKRNVQAAGVKIPADGSLPTTVVLRADKDTSFTNLYTLITACQASGFRKFALKAMSGPS
ncbi:MAG: biopolymer transporter ExbD [Isosphaeraceae bacterium]|nr:biopolymer transporter ExbD [Isosphaeraceae bacterium]